MSIHDWTKAQSNQFHHFHQDWTVEIARILNGGVLPDGYFAQLEQHTASRLPSESDSMIYAQKAIRLAVRHPDGSVVAIIEVASPGNKDSKHAIQAFTRKEVNLLSTISEPCLHYSVSRL